MRIAVAFLAAVLTACSGGPVEVGTGARGAVGESSGSDAPGSKPKRDAITTTTTTTAAPTTTTTQPPPPPPPPPPAVGTVPAQGFGPGDRGPQVKMLENRLAALFYGTHFVDDVYDQDTADSVVAFQKAVGLPRTGRATQDVADALTTARHLDPLAAGGGPTRVEIDLPRQILLLWENDGLSRVLPVSTASGKRFCQGGRCRTSVTPAGSYRVGYRLPGWRKSPLGLMYKPVYYMVGIGIAIHGSRDVPVDPASHGCVRIPMSAAEWFPDKVPDGTPVYVLDGKTPPGPPPPEGTRT